MKTLYTAHGSATGGREGHGATSDKVVDVTLTTPKELGGDGATGTNPEQLFAIGYSACFLGAMKFVAGQEKKKVPGDAAEDLVHKADIVCPYSHSLRGNVPVSLTVA